MTQLIITAEQRAILADALTPFADKITSVRLFGSRATGIARENSDIDLVIYGELDTRSERRLWTSLDESHLPVAVDLVVYSRINNPLLKEHIDLSAVELFSQENLADLRSVRRDSGNNHTSA